jgi:A circularly permuted ATPgrasp
VSLRHASDDAAVSTEATRRWHELLRSTPFDDPGLEQLRLVRVGSRRAVIVARPFLMTPVRYEQERLACRLVGSALKKLSAAIWQDPSLLDELEVSDAERALVTIDPGFSELDVTDRFDGFVGKRLGFVELQGGVPGGVGLVDVAANAFTETAMFEQLADEYELRSLPALPALQQALLETWRDWGGSGDPTVAIVDWDDAPLMMEFELVRDSLRDAGVPALIADPRTLRFEGGRLRHDSGTVDLVYRRLTIFDTIARPDETRALVDAARAGAVCVVNPFASDLMGHKSVFALLTESHDLGLTDAERNAVHNHVPWTRRLSTSPGGDVVAPDYVLEHRSDLVVKPAHDYGGHGVQLGWEHEPGEWERIVTEAAREDTIVQRRVWAHHEEFPRDEPGFPLQRYYVDTDPFVFRRHLGSLLVRLSTEGVTNVSAGGSAAPAFLVLPR